MATTHPSQAKAQAAIHGVLLAVTAGHLINDTLQELLPGRVGLISGLFFGVVAVGAALLGWLADVTSIGFVFHLCSFLPAIGLLTMFLPNARTAQGSQSG
jgi:FSR family fosmidomycin resistance protein-like MFS transporter